MSNKAAIAAGMGIVAGFALLVGALTALGKIKALDPALIACGVASVAGLVPIFADRTPAKTSRCRERARTLPPSSKV